MQGADGAWRPFGDGNAAAVAVPLEHTVPCVGWVFTEPPKPGSLRIDRVRPRLQANREALRAAGVRVPETLLGRVKDGHEVALPDGTVLDPLDPEVMSPPVPGRRFALLGDTCAPSLAAAREAWGCDLLVHEATNALTPDDGCGRSGAEESAGYAAVRAKAVSHGHSTPQMAGAFARAVGAATTALSHFSARYKGGADPDDVAAMAVLAEQARRMRSGRPDDVAAAHRVPRAGGGDDAGAEAPGAEAGGGTAASAATLTAPVAGHVTLSADAAARAPVSGSVVAAFDMMTLTVGFKRSGPGPRGGVMATEVGYDAAGVDDA